MKPYTAKVNVAGSWANLVTFSPSRIGEIKAACEAIAKSHLGHISFKVFDGESVVEQFSSSPRAGEPHGWYNPALKNPVQAGVDRTVSGAIGQP